MKKKIWWHKKIWLIFCVSVLFLSILFSLLISIPLKKLNFDLLIIIALLPFLIIMAITIIHAWAQVPQKYEYIVEVFGKYIGKPLESGLHFIFPWFKWEQVYCKVYMGEQMIKLYLDEKKIDLPGGGDVEFKDSSAPLSAFFYFQIFDSAKSAYNIEDVIRAIEEKADEKLRVFLGMYTLDQAINLRTKFEIKIIACSIDVSASNFKTPTHKEFKNTDFYKTLYSWGVVPKSFTVSDIQLPPNIIAQREKIINAEKELEATAIKEKQAEIDKRIKIIEADAIKQSTELKGKGESEARAAIINRMVEELKKAKISQKDIVRTIIEFQKWQAVSLTDNALIIEGSGGPAASGSKFGAGFNEGQNLKSNEKKP